MHDKVILRPIQQSDLSQILVFAKEAGYGFNFLSTDSQKMESRIQDSIDSFAGVFDQPKRKYVFVLENIDTNEIIGTGAIKCCVGEPWPFYKYKISDLAQASNVLQCKISHQLLTLVSEHEEATELGGLFLKPSYRGKGVGRFLSRSRCLFISDFPDLFSDYIIADLRGISTPEGVSPFWESLGRHFFGIDYDEASRLKASKGPNFMIELMPQHPIYIDLLSPEAQAVIGKPHCDTRGAMQTLENENFRFQQCIDIFDGGPTIEVDKAKIKTMVDSDSHKVCKIKNKIDQESLAWISNSRMDYRATMAPVEISDAGICLSSTTASALMLEVGEKCRVLIITGGNL